MANVLVTLILREKLLFVLTLLWGVDHLVGWFVYPKYGIGITALAGLAIIGSIVGFLLPHLALISLNGLSLVFFVGLLGPTQSTMTFAFLLATLLVRVTYREPRPWAGAYIASAVYLFAGLNKAFSEDWMDGKIIGFYFPEFILNWEINGILARSTVAIELGLALLLFLRLRIAIVGIIALHVGIVLCVTANLYDVFSLGIYGAIMVHLAYWSSTLKLRNLILFFRGKG